MPVEDWLINESAKKKIEHGPWIYNGSMVHEGTFLALVTSPTALINNPRKGNDNDEMWNVNGESTPGVTTPVEITFKLVLPAAPEPAITR